MSDARGVQAVGWIVGGLIAVGALTALAIVPAPAQAGDPGSAVGSVRVTSHLPGSVVTPARASVPRAEARVVMVMLMCPYFVADGDFFIGDSELTGCTRPDGRPLPRMSGSSASPTTLGPCLLSRVGDQFAKCDNLTGGRLRQSAG